MSRKAIVPQEQFLKFITTYKGKNGEYPCNHTLQKEFEVTAMTIWNYWNRLSDKGLLDLDEMRENMERRELPPVLYQDHTEKILDFITTYSHINGFPPSTSEVAEYIGVSTPIITKYYKRMEQKGLISRVANRARSVRVL